MSHNQDQSLIDQLLLEYQNKENDFPVVENTGDIPTGYRGLAMEINDHGNVTIYRVFKNGNCREIASRV